MTRRWIPFRNPVVAALAHLAATVLLIETALLIVAGQPMPYPFWQRVPITAVVWVSGLDLWRRTRWYRRAEQAAEQARRLAEQRGWPDRAG